MKKTKKQHKSEDSPIRCDYILMSEEVEEGKRDFKLFNETDISLLSCKIADAQLKEAVCDNDCQTDNEQIQDAARMIENDLCTALLAFKKRASGVNNIAKYQHDRVIEAKRHRIY